MAFFERFQATELSSLLSLVDKVQSVITENDYKDNLGVEFPDIVVCGGQSAGKSSVLQALAGVNLPQSSSITTRVALRLSLMVDHGIQESSARIGIDQALQAQDSAETFSESQYHKLGERVTTLTNRLAGPPPNETGDNLTSLEPPNINVESTIFLRVVRKEGPQMTLVDLPGISHHTTKMKDDTVNCFQRRFANSNHILLLVLNAVVDPMSQHALTLAREADPGGRRTLCVLTHIDKRFQEDRDEFLKTFRQLDNIVGHGVFPVLTKPPKPGHTLEDARNEEDRYFSEHASELGLDPKACGIRALGVRLMEKQSPIVRESLNTLVPLTRNDLCGMKKEFAELSYVAHQPNRDTEATNRVLEKVQREFESFDKGSQEESCPGKNISILTKERYECFAKEVNNIAPKWLTDDYRRNTLDPFVAEYGASDLNVKWTSAEIGLFAGAFRHKLENTCIAMVMDIGTMVKRVLMLMLEGWTKPLGRPRLLPHLETLVDVFVEKRVRKAREVVSYLCKAEMAKRSTQDDTYDRIKRKVKRRSEIAHARSDPETFGSVQLPHAQVLDRYEDDDDVVGIPEEFVSSYFHRAVKLPVNHSERETVYLQLSLFSYTRTVTRRIIDMVSMQAQLLMVTSVYEDEVSHDFDNRDLVADLREAIRALSPKEFENIMIVNAEREKRWKNLRNNIHANETILKLLKEGGIGTDHGGVNTLTGEFWRN